MQAPTPIPEAIQSAVEQAVLQSFQTRPLPLRVYTQRECKRRFEMCEAIVLRLRVELGWSIRRICDHLYPLLLAKLDQSDFSPSHRTLWSPTPNKGKKHGTHN